MQKKKSQNNERGKFLITNKEKSVNCRKIGYGYKLYNYYKLYNSLKLFNLSKEEVF